MAIITEGWTRKTIDLTGPQGNAFALMSTARQLAKDLELDSQKIIAEMKMSDYKNLVLTFDKYFGIHVDLICKDKNEFV